ncbi:MAG: hypothetical protein GEU73_14430 [Chloroflexi bacterium]|nr:hypothetical protein [Chloroflexota bacterium]
MAQIVLNDEEQALRAELLQKYDPMTSDVLRQYIELASPKLAESRLSAWRRGLVARLNSVFAVAASYHTEINEGRLNSWAPLAVEAAWDFSYYVVWEARWPGDTEVAYESGSAMVELEEAAVVELWRTLELPEGDGFRATASRGVTV